MSSLEKLQLLQCVSDNFYDEWQQNNSCTTSGDHTISGELFVYTRHRYSLFYAAGGSWRGMNEGDINGEELILTLKCSQRLKSAGYGCGCILLIHRANFSLIPAIDGDNKMYSYNGPAKISGAHMCSAWIEKDIFFQYLQKAVRHLRQQDFKSCLNENMGIVINNSDMFILSHHLQPNQGDSWTCITCKISIHDEGLHDTIRVVKPGLMTKSTLANLLDTCKTPTYP